MKCHQSALSQRKLYHHLHCCNYNKAKDKIKRQGVQSVRSCNKCQMCGESFGTDNINAT